MGRESMITAEPPEAVRQEPHQTNSQNQNPSRDHDDFSGPLLAPDASEKMRSRWEAIQGAFVDDPKNAVQGADDLVATAVRRLSETFAAERAKLEQQWSKGADVSTEDLRLALRRYRTFFHRLLAV